MGGACNVNGVIGGNARGKETTWRGGMGRCGLDRSG
jgi:hypothetical protein